MLLVVNPKHPQPHKINQAVEILREGGVVIYPTDTYYGIGCDLFNKKALERVYQIKRRPQSKPFSFICGDLKDISQYAIVSNYAYKTMRRLLPAGQPGAVQDRAGAGGLTRTRLRHPRRYQIPGASHLMSPADCAPGS